MEKEQLHQIIREETYKLKSLGYNPYFRKLQFNHRTSSYALAWQSRGLIEFSVYFLDASDMEIRGTIMHELIHLCKEAGHGHGFAWKAIAEKVNKAYPEYNIKRLGSQLKGVTHAFSLQNARIKNCKDTSRPNPYVRVRCNECGHVYWVSRRSKLLSYLEDCKCSLCNGSLTRI